jgi:hypothetical protein
MEGTVQVGALLQYVIAGLVTIVTGLAAFALKRIISVDRKMGQMETWREGHDKQDDERHEENLAKFDAIFDAISKRR